MLPDDDNRLVYAWDPDLAATPRLDVVFACLCIDEQVVIIHQLSICSPCIISLTANNAYGRVSTEGKSGRLKMAATAIVSFFGACLLFCTHISLLCFLFYMVPQNKPMEINQICVCWFSTSVKRGVDSLVD